MRAFHGQFSDDSCRLVWSPILTRFDAGASSRGDEQGGAIRNQFRPLLQRSETPIWALIPIVVRKTILITHTNKSNTNTQIYEVQQVAYVLGWQQFYYMERNKYTLQMREFSTKFSATSFLSLKFPLTPLFFTSALPLFYRQRGSEDELTHELI